MKLAQALKLRKQLKDSIGVLQSRAVQYAYRNPLPDGSVPPMKVDPNQVVRDMLSTSQKLTALIIAINDTNNATSLENGLTLSRAIVTRDQMLVLSTAVSAVSSGSRGYGSRPDKGAVYDLDTELAYRTGNDLARQARELDDLIQAANWTTDLLPINLEVMDAIIEVTEPVEGEDEDEGSGDDDSNDDE